MPFDLIFLPFFDYTNKLTRIGSILPRLNGAKAARSNNSRIRVVTLLLQNRRTTKGSSAHSPKMKSDRVVTRTKDARPEETSATDIIQAHKRSAGVLAYLST